MPSFTQEVDVDIDVYDFFTEMDKREKKEMFKYLTEDQHFMGWLKKNEPNTIKPFTSNVSVVQFEFNECIDSIKSGYLRLSSEEIETLLSISKKL